MGTFNFSTGEETKLVKRIKSFLWRALPVGVLAVTSYIQNIGNIQELEMKQIVTVFIVAVNALIVGEITKYLNTKK